MLPQLAKTQKRIDKLTNKAMFDGWMAAAPLLSKVCSYQHHEGQTALIENDLGATEKITMEKTSVEYSVETKPMTGETLEELFQYATKAGAEMGQKMQQHLIKAVEEAAEGVGNVVTIQNGELTADALIEMINKVQIDFDEKDQPLSSFFLPPALQAQLNEKSKAWMKNPELVAKIQEITNRKREEFRAREASRRLVD